MRRCDFWLSTNSIEYTDPSSAEMDANCAHSSVRLLVSTFILLPAPGPPFPNFIERRMHVKVKYGGLGFRPHSNRFLLLDSLCKTVPLAIDRKDEKGKVTRGLWNSLTDMLSARSFDAVNKESYYGSPRSMFQTFFWYRPSCSHHSRAGIMLRHLRLAKTLVKIF